MIGKLSTTQETSIKNTQLEQLIISQISKDKLPKKIKDGFKDLKDGMLDEKALNGHVDELIKSVKTRSTDRTEEEQKAFLLKGVRDLIELLEEGARVEVFNTDDEDAENGNDNTATATTLIYTKYNQIEQKTKLINAKINLKIPKGEADEELEE